MRPILILIVLSPLFLACNGSRIPPKHAFEDYAPAPVPDYAQQSAWSCLPDKEDFADKTPPGVESGQDTAQVDVFFIHPTTFMGGLAWNASVQDQELNAKTDERAILHQASLFNGSGRVFAPRYRQMSFGGFFTEDTLSKIKALNLAYEDVKASFVYYLENLNQGRPILIASHSQGSIHGIRLVREFFDGQELQDKLVAAYLVGWPFPADTFQSIPVCQSPEETGCVLSWCTWKEGYQPESLDTYYQDAVVVNPLHWQADSSLAHKEMHQGFLKGNYKKIKAQALQAQVHQGILWVSNPIPLAGNVKNYHVGDYNLFWLDVRENVAQRVTAYLTKSGYVNAEK